ncbi:MAG: glutamate-1-semialdehyde 2,1-aminomutase [marine bacterium B5-7]|nr:MAG: glutamate-1-semialdehyde 2,1-aminomutase [marine bacterium B5-7]
MSISAELFDQSQQCIPGGVNSPVRAFGSVGGTPIFFERGEGAYLYSVDNQKYTDYVGSWGPLILGHAHPHVIEAVMKAARKGLTFGAPTENELRLAQRLCKIIPSLDQVRMVSSGTEATMSALRLARGFTGRDKIIKFEGGYHGHNDALLVKAGSGALTFGSPSSPGVPEDFVKHTLVAQFNDLDSVHEHFEENPGEIAALIVEPVAGNMGCIPPANGFLQGLRDVCDKHGTLLIFDEVITGFRVDLGGAQTLYGVTPDLTTLGKIIGGGLPVGAFGGRKDIMAMLSPLGPVYQAGTLSGNPIACAAGLATLDVLEKPDLFASIIAQTKKLTQGLRALADKHHIPMVINQVGTMFSFHFTSDAHVHSFADVMRTDAEQYHAFFHAMLASGFYFAPSAYETSIVTLAHNNEVIDDTLDAFDAVFESMKMRVA